MSRGGSNFPTRFWRLEANRLDPCFDFRLACVLAALVRRAFRALDSAWRRWALGATKRVARRSGEWPWATSVWRVGSGDVISVGSVAWATASSVGRTGDNARVG